MKVKVLTPIESYKNTVYLYTIGDYDIPLQEVIDKFIINIDSLPKFDLLDGTAFKQKYLNFIFNIKNNKLVEIPILKLKHRGKVRGIIVYRNFTDLAEYILKYYQPTDNTYEINKILKELSPLSKQKQKELLIEWLLRTKEIKEYERNVFRRYYVDINEKTVPFIYEYSLLLSSNSSSSQLKIYPTAKNNNVLVYTTTEKIGTIIYVDGYNQNINNVKIKRYKAFIVNYGRGIIFYQNGRTELFAYDDCKLLQILGKKTYLLFNEFGKVKEIDREYIIPSEFKTLFLVRVPSYNEINERKIKNQIKNGKMPKITTPMLIYDTRTNLDLNENCVVITSVEESISILLRSPKWIFLPSATPSEANLLQYLEDEPYFIALGTASLEKLCSLIPTNNNEQQKTTTEE